MPRTRGRDGGHAGLVHPRVGDVQRRPRRAGRAWSRENSRERLGAALLVALDHVDEVAGHRPVELAAGAHRAQVDHDRRLVVGHAAPVDAAVADLGRERIRLPLGRVGGLHVVVPVDQDRRRVRIRARERGQDDRVARGRERGHLVEARIASLLLDPLGAARDRRLGGRAGADARERDELGERRELPRLGRVQVGPQPGPVAHVRAVIRPRRRSSARRSRSTRGCPSRTSARAPRARSRRPPRPRTLRRAFSRVASPRMYAR